jgi:chlorobactene glucosyltransferase
MMLMIAAGFLLLLVAANVAFWPRVRRFRLESMPRLSVLIPARDEEGNLPDCLDSVLKQPEVAEVLVYDDHSADRTREVVTEYAQRDYRVRLIDPAPLAAGWCGKTFACHELAKRARSRWLLFLDADARLATGATARALPEAEARCLTFLSCWPGLEMLGFWERALMPLLNFVVFTLYPAPLALSRPDPSLGLAHGAFILVRKDCYDKVGGHGAVRAEIFEDTRLARLWRERGERSLCLDGQDIVRVRMYGGFGGIWSGFQKNFYPAFQSRAMFCAFLALHAFVFLGPFLTLNWIAAGCVLAMRLLLAIRFRHPLWSVLLHPLAQTLLLALGVSSWWLCRAGRGVVWKRRRYRSA